MPDLSDLLRMDVKCAAKRLFDGYELEIVEGMERYEAFVVGRLLEEGGSDDLRQLAEIVPESRWRSWLESEGGLGLSDRSRVFWSLLLDAAAPKPPGKPAR